MRAAILLMLSIAAPTGCQSVGVSSCEIASGSGEWTCFEWEGEPYVTTRDQCRAFGGRGKWADTACPRERAIGGCRLYIGGRTFTEWRGGATTEERLREECQLKAPVAGSSIRAEYLPGGARANSDAGGQ